MRLLRRVGRRLRKMGAGVRDDIALCICTGPKALDRPLASSPRVILRRGTQARTYGMASVWSPARLCLIAVPPAQHPTAFARLPTWWQRSILYKSARSTGMLFMPGPARPLIS